MGEDGNRLHPKLKTLVQVLAVKHPAANVRLDAGNVTLVESVVAAVAGLAALNYFTLQHQLNNIDSSTSVCQAVMYKNFIRSLKIFKNYPFDVCSHNINFNLPTIVQHIRIIFSAVTSIAEFG